MARDYARKKPAVTRKKRYEPRVPAWVWLFTGSVLGAFIVFLMNIAKVEDAPPSQLTLVDKLPLTSPAKPGASTPDTKVEKPDSPYSFPTLLRDSEVKVPEGSSNLQAESEPAFEYSLQVASFKSLDDAEQIRAELILLNMDAKIEAATVRENETWHRVVVGPFTSRSKLSKARSTLISNNYGAQVRKRSIPG